MGIAIDYHSLFYSPSSLRFAYVDFQCVAAFERDSSHARHDLPSLSSTSSIRRSRDHVSISCLSSLSVRLAALRVDLDSLKSQSIACCSISFEMDNS